MLIFSNTDYHKPSAIDLSAFKLCGIHKAPPKMPPLFTTKLLSIVVLLLQQIQKQTKEIIKQVEYSSLWGELVVSSSFSCFIFL